METRDKAFERLYDQHSPLLYGIALRMSPSVADAESIVTTAFQEIYNQKAFNHDHTSLSWQFVRLIIRIAHDKFNPAGIKNYFNLPHFENTPLLHYLICEQNGIEGYCELHKLTRSGARMQLHQEYLRLGKDQINIERKMTPDPPLDLTA